MEKIAVFWFRRDLRLDDNRGLQQALASGHKVLPLFIYDRDILDQLPAPYDRRVDYIHQAVKQLDAELQKYGSALAVFHSRPAEVFLNLLRHYSIAGVYANRDYEPEAIQRDQEVNTILAKAGLKFFQSKDQVIFEKSEVVKGDGTPYTVYTPYASNWKASLEEKNYAPAIADFHNFLQRAPEALPALRALGFEKTDIHFEPPEIDPELIGNYDQDRDFPGRDRTTRLGMALRFGTISIRKCVAAALQHNEVWLSELIWREFFMQILAHFPAVVRQCFKPEYEWISWRNDEAEFEAWCNGRTGYPLVDAGMKQLNQTGYMHNRVRMVAASFLCKHLLIDWRWGERYFAEKLNDYELASNNGNWQWAAGCGCDAAPYFRIFNPQRQQERFDREKTYISRWLPDLNERNIAPIVEHNAVRKRALEVYKAALERKHSGGS